MTRRKKDESPSQFEVALASGKFKLIEELGITSKAIFYQTPILANGRSKETTYLPAASCLRRCFGRQALRQAGL